MIDRKKLSSLIAGTVIASFSFGLEVVQAHPGHSPFVPHEITPLSTATTEQVLVISPEAPDRPVYSVTSGITTFLAYDGETNNVFSLFKDVIAPNNGAIPHLHTRQDEFYYILDGTANVITGGTTKVVTAGNFIFLPKGNRHGFTNIGSTPLQMLVGVTPAGFEGFFIDQNKPVIDRSNPPPPEQDLAVIGQLSQKYGTELALDPATPSKGLTDLDFLITKADTPGRYSYTEAGGVYTSLANDAETGNQFSLFDVLLAPQAGSTQVVKNEKESLSFYVLDGDLTFQIGNETKQGIAGTYIYLPKGTPYSFQNMGTSSARTLLFKTPVAVPEPATILGVLAVSILAATSLVKRKQPLLNVSREFHQKI
ncbi:MAG: cupin domain-containing protein [Nostoc sp.]|uniref:cupin domain-containing protein n=1 Tax=unclassified Nostoc TaxID=2593658 RepID=UPI0025CCAE58|nr:cupin domain-containing protein [Nostoc sp. NMS9]MBN3944688.1 cupin domain-containing protein [Nostoc sp. NMS9]